MSMARHEAAVRAHTGLSDYRQPRREDVRRAIVDTLRAPRGVSLGSGRLARVLLQLAEKR